MKVNRLFSAGAALALLGAFGASGLQAQEGYSYALKIRAGLTAGDIQKTHFDNKVLGFGAEVKREILGGGRAVTAELTWEYIPGRHHDIYPWNTNPLELDPKFSWDNRKEYGQGFSLRLAYSAPFNVNLLPGFLPELSFEWFAGLGIDRYKVRSQAEWILDFDNASSHTPVAGRYDGGTVVKEGTSFVPGIFGGLKYRVNSDFGLELTVRNFGMHHFDFTPNAYSVGRPPSDQYGKEFLKTDTGTSRGWSLEFAISSKL